MMQPAIDDSALKSCQKATLAKSSLLMQNAELGLKRKIQPKDGAQ
jgi:hypothetical protein